MLTKSQRHHESALLRSAHTNRVVALFMLATFVYSFVAQEPDAMDQPTRSMQNSHYEFLTIGRWWFLVGCLGLMIAAQISVKKANGLRAGKFRAADGPEK